MSTFNSGEVRIKIGLAAAGAELNYWWRSSANASKGEAAQRIQAVRRKPERFDAGRHQLTADTW